MESTAITRNRKALHDYEILESFEAGIELLGSEVKSLRAGHVNLTDCYGQCVNGQVFLVHLHIGPYTQGSMYGHEPYRKRRLLLQRRQIGYLRRELEQKKLTLVPLKLYFKKQWVKVEIALARGRRVYDKRQKIAEQENKRRLAHVMALSRRR